MSKKLSFLMLLMALFAPWAANAQTRETITIGTGTSANYYPLPGFYGWQYDVYLYTPSDASALNSDCSIFSIAFNVSFNSSTTGASMEIWVKDVDASYTLASSTTFSTYTSGATKVYNNTNFSSVSGWNTLSFSSSFSHTGGKALLVAVRGVGCSTSGGCSRSCYYTSASNSWWYKHTDGTTDPGTSASGTVSSNRANIQLEINGGGGGQGGDDDCDLSEDFDGVTGTSYSTAGSMPSGWYSYTTATGSSIVAPHVVSGSSYNYYHSSSQSLGMESGTNANNTAYAVMPAIASGKTYSSLSFYYRQESTSSGYGTLTVGYVMAQTSTGCSNFVPVQEITASTTLHEETVDVSSVPANAYLAFRWIVTSGSYYACGIDDVCVTTVSSSGCPTPTSLAIVDNSITTQGATFTWNGTSDSYLVMVKESSQPESANYTYDFEDGWQGWTTFQGNTTSPNSWMHNTAYPTSNNDFSTGYGYNNSDGFMLSESYISGSSSGAGQAVTPDNYLVSPQVPLGGSISFYAGARNTDYCAEKFSVMVSTTDNTNAASFTTVGTWTLSLSSAGYTSSPYTVDLSAYSGMGYVAIRHFDCYDQWFLAVDDITIDTGGESPWTTYPASASPFTINGLNPGTTYDVKVIGICDGEESNASTTINFTTDIACPAPTEVNVSDITGHEATVTWTGNSESYNVYLGTEGAPTNILNVNFSSGIPNNWNNDASYPWAATGGYIKSGNTGVASSSSSISVVMTFPSNGTIDFDAECMGEGTGNYYDHCDFYIDGTRLLYHGADLGSGWNHYTYDVTAGEHTFTWSYNKDSSVNPDGDYFAIDNVVMVSSSIIWGDPIHVENAQYTFGELTPETTYFVSVQSDCGNEGLSSMSSPILFTTEVSCPAPTGLTVSDINGHGATVRWDRVADADHPTVYFQFVCVEHGGTPDWTDAPVAIDRPTNPNPPTGFFSGLAPETEYDAYIRRICGTISPSGVIDGEFSAPTIITFTTTVTCPAPTDVNVSNITGHEAMVAWTGSSENYIVRYSMANFISGIPEEFGTSIPSGWTQASGLVDNVLNGTALGSASQWSFGNANSVFDDHARINIYGTSKYGWLITPAYTIVNGNVLSFDLALTDYSGNNGIHTGTCDDDRFIVLISTDNKASWTILREWNNNGSAHVYNDINVDGELVILDLNSFAGQTVYIAFYGESTVGSNGDNNLHIDNVAINTFIPTGEWQTVTVDDTSVTLTGLDPETLYEVVVQGDCGDEGMSAESEPVTFITDVTCPAPHDLTTSDITSNSAMLHWEGDAESYNVSYYKAYFFDSFEEDLSQWTIIKEGDDGSFEWGIENPHDNSADLNAHGGNYAAVAYSDTDVHADNWLITPQITMPTQATLKFWVMRSTYDDAQDEYEVRLSTTGNAVEDFDVVLQEKAAASSTWTEVSIDLSEYDGQLCYIAIHHDFTSGFFIMVDDFGIFGWSEPIATTENSLLIEDLLPETDYQWKVQANCGEEDGLSQWAIDNFTTLKACPVPFDLNVSKITANGATIAWTGYSERYEVLVSEGLYMAYDFENHTISDDFANSSSYPWTVVQEGQGGSYCLKSGNGGISNSTSAIEMTIDLVMDATLSFDFWSRGEGSNDTYDWDKSRFYIDGTSMFDYASHSSWESYSTTLTAGTHTLKWEYKKDGSTNPDGDCFYVDNITIESVAVSSEMNYTATESPLLLNDASYFLPETTYLVKVKGICEDEETEYSEAVTFTTLDENTKIFVIEGEWSNGDNWVPAGVPSIEQDVILRAEATVFDVAEANIITIDNAGALTIEDGGQLKTNADVEATMKKFIIGYGTDYVETNDGYYLMTLPIADPISAADAGLLTEESEYDLYSWDRTATDEEWQNNHDGIDMQNGAGYLYANQDDMEMSFTATLRNSSESIVMTPAYDEVEHGGWNLYGNPFPCEAYITTDAEDMTFYRLVGNQLELIEGAIAPLEAFFVKATAAGQTFTISREVPAK